MINTPQSAWTDMQTSLADFAQRQLFFIGGAPRSGTTWLQLMVDQHPDICCRGEGLFMQHLAVPLEQMMQARHAALAAKNREVFGDRDGYPLPPPEHAECLIGTAILLALQQQAAGARCRAIGEKTPENVFFFTRMKALFPAAKLIVVARDPRDLLSSAWHFFARHDGVANTDAARAAYVAQALPAIEAGLRATVKHAQSRTQDCHVVTYEALHRAPAEHLAQLCRFLGVSDAPDVLAACVQATRFEALAGRMPGHEDAQSFYRQGLPGQWRSTLSEAVAATIVQQLGWAFPIFGWPL